MLFKILFDLLRQVSQSFGRYSLCSHSDVIAASLDPATIVAPFVAVIREPYLSGPHKLTALDTLQTFLSCNVLVGYDTTADTLTDIVDSITR